MVHISLSEDASVAFCFFGVGVFWDAFGSRLRFSAFRSSAFLGLASSGVRV